jgi:chaperonin GroEL
MSTNVSVKQGNVFDIIQSTVNKIVNLIRPTYGPAGNKVIISKMTHRLVVDDGVQIARDLEFEDEAENAVLNIVRETAVKTNDRVGDGTTSSLIMLQAIINEVSKLGRRDGHKIEKELNKGFTEVEAQLRSQAKLIKTKDELKKVARISFDDQKISEIIADTWFKLGKDGVVTADRSGTMETFAEITEGIAINRGYISPYMITNPARMEGVVEKPYILLTDYRMTEVNDIIPIMNLLAGKQILNLVIIADNLEGNALATAIINRMQSKFNVTAINIPAGENKVTFLEDIAVMTGGKVFSQAKGDKIETAKIEDLGRADRFIAKRDSSVIIGPRGKKAVIQKAIEDIKLSASIEASEVAKKEAEKRVARFSNKVAVIKVGAATEAEERALKYKVEDSINAVQAAYRGGVVCGAGLSLSRIVTCSPILNEALKAPHKQLKDNMGIENVRELDQNEAINAITGKIGDYMEIGVLDPVDVLIAGVESAVSIASLLCTTSGMICEAQKKPPVE